jgi:hypothetical protein
MVGLLAGLAAGCGDSKIPQPGLDYGPEDGSAAAEVKDDSATYPASITSIARGSIYRTTFTSTRRWRAFKFAGKAGDQVDVFLDGLNGLDTVVYIYKISRLTGRPFGTPLAVNDDTDEPGWIVRSNTSANPLSSSLRSVRLPEDRNYAVVATTYRQWYVGSAEIVVKDRDAEGRQCAGFMYYPPCPEGYVCDISVPNACNGADLPGYCRPKPEMCTLQYQPVCGCDGRTYPNDCARLAAGVQLDHEGECAPTGGDVGALCGSRGLQPCKAGLWCRYPPESACGETDRPGTCQEPSGGYCIQIYDPVCGCNGQTYPNSCHADAAQVSIRHRGACR